MSYFSLYYSEKYIGHSIKLSSVDHSDLRYLVGLLQNVLDSPRYRYLSLYMYEKHQFDFMYNCNFTKHTEILFPQIKMEGNYRNSVPWGRHLSS